MHPEDELERGTSEEQPMLTTDRGDLPREERWSPSQILAELNRQFGTDFNENETDYIQTIQERLSMDEDLAASLQGKKPDEARQIFGHVVREIVRSIYEAEYKIYMRVKNDQDFAAYFAQRLFERLQRRVKEEGGPNE